MVRDRVEFRASWLIRFAVLLALLVWVTIGLAAAIADALPNYVFASIAFFVLFFMIFVAYYWNMAYVVDEYGVTYRGATDFEHFPWEDIIHIRTSDIPLGGYYVTTRRGGFVLSGFIHGHEKLRELIVARAELLPYRRASGLS